MPWWQRQMYVEMMNEEFSPDDFRQDEHDGNGNSTGPKDFASFGVTMQTIE